MQTNFDADVSSNNRDVPAAYPSVGLQNVCATFAHTCVQSVCHSARWQNSDPAFCCTCQHFDFNLPQRLDIRYVAAQIQLVDGADTCAVTYCLGGLRFPEDGATGDFIS